MLDKDGVNKGGGRPSIKAGDRFFNDYGSEYGFEDTAMMAFVTSIPLLVIGIATTLFGLGIITIV